MSQYAIDKDLRLLRHFSPPLQRAILPMASRFLRVAQTGFARQPLHMRCAPSYGLPLVRA